MGNEPGYDSPTVNVATSLPKRGVGSSILIVPVVSSGDEERAGAAPRAVVAAADPLLSAEAVGEIEAGLKALDATVSIAGRRSWRQMEMTPARERSLTT